MAESIRYLEIALLRGILKKFSDNFKTLFLHVKRADKLSKLFVLGSETRKTFFVIYVIILRIVTKLIELYCKKNIFPGVWKYYILGK